MRAQLKKRNMAEGGGAGGRKGIRECPIFYPTAEEFSNFEQYVLSIEPHCLEHGICKVVPPEVCGVVWAREIVHMHTKQLAHSSTHRRQKEDYVRAVVVVRVPSHICICS